MLLRRVVIAELRKRVAYSQYVGPSAKLPSAEYALMPTRRLGTALLRTVLTTVEVESPATAEAPMIIAEFTTTLMLSARSDQLPRNLNGDADVVESYTRNDGASPLSTIAVRMALRCWSVHALYPQS